MIPGKAPKRVFSDSLKRKIIKDLEQGKLTVAQAGREYSVSIQSVYKWLEKYSKLYDKQVRVVVEAKSELFRSKELEIENKNLQAALGRKQLEVEFLNEMIKRIGDELGVDIKKKLSTTPSIGSVNIKKGGRK
jgi:transposase-like protein